METNRTSGIGNDNALQAARIGGNTGALTQSGLAGASDARIAAAQAALHNGAIQPTPRAQLAEFTPVQNAGPQGQFAQTQTASIPPAPSTRELAAMAADVYAPGTAPPPGWELATGTELAAIGLTENMLSSPQSEFRAEVYTRDIAGQTSYVVSFRGTQSGSDWAANLKQGAGFQTDHYNRALEIGRRVIVPEGARVTLTGHSLGGGLASAASLAAEIDAVTFNAAGLSQTTLGEAQTIAGRDGRIDVPDISAFYVRGEILSTLQDGGDRMVGALIGGLFGARNLDMPEAVGDRIELEPVRPDDMRWYQDNAVSRHYMSYVLSSLPQ